MRDRTASAVNMYCETGFEKRLDPCAIVKWPLDIREYLRSDCGLPSCS